MLKFPIVFLPTESDSSRARWLTSVVALSILTALSGIFFLRFAHASVILQRIIPPLAISGLVLAASLTIGMLALNAATKLFSYLGKVPTAGETASRLDMSFFGLPLYGCLMGAIAWLGFHVSLFVASLTFALAACGLLMLIRQQRVLILEQPSPWTLIAISPVLILGLLQALGPVTSPDELVYKLAIPRQYILHGAMVELPLSSQSYSSGALSLVSLSAIVLSGSTAAKLIHFFGFLFCLRAIAQLSHTILPGSEKWSLIAVAATPALGLIAGWAWTEWIVIGLLLASYHQWVLFLTKATAERAALTFLFLAAAIAVKYTALLWLILFLLTAVIRLRQRKDISVIRMLYAAVIVLLFGGFFYFRNFVWTGSPVAPFLLPEAPGVAHYRSSGELGGWEELIKGYDIFYASLIDDSLGILMPASVLLCLLSPSLLWRWRDLLLIGLVQLVAFKFAALTSRLSLTAIIPLSQLGTAVAYNGWKSAGRLLKSLLFVAFFAALIGQLILIFYIFIQSTNYLPYLAGQETEWQNIKRTRHFAQPYEWVASRSPSDSTIFLLGETRVYYLERRCIAASNSDGPRMAAYLAQFKSAKDFSEAVRKLGIDYFLLQPKWIRVVKELSAAPPIHPVEGEYVVTLPENTYKIFREYVSSYTKLVYEDSHYKIFQVKGN